MKTDCHQRSCTQTWSFGRSSAFTLIELLLVITIIAVLSALLFTGSKTMRTKADIARCLGHIRALGVALRDYSNENNGFLIEDELPKLPGTSTILWPHQLNRYFGINFSAISVQPELVLKTPLHCPAERELIKPYSCYSLNKELNRRLMGESSRIHTTAVVSPSKYVLLSDSSTSSVIYTDTAKKLKEYSQVDRRHDSHPNFLFADGHAEYWREPLIGLADPNGTSPEIRAMWQARYQR